MIDRVKDWMSTEIVDVAPDEPLFRAVELMAERGIRHVLVRAGRGDPDGIVSNRDVIRGFRQRRLDLHGVTVAQVMTPAPLYTTDPEATLSQAATMMHRHKLSALPVVDGDRIVGIITSDDILSAVAQENGGD